MIIVWDIRIVIAIKSRGNIFFISVASAFIVFVCFFSVFLKICHQLLFIYFVFVDGALFYIFSVLSKRFYPSRNFLF